MMLMNATDDINYDFTHDHGGSGWAIVQDLGDNFWRVAAITNNGVDGRYVALAWGKKLKRTQMPIDPDDPKSPLVDRRLNGTVLDAVVALRADLALGRKIVRDQRVLDA